MSEFAEKMIQFMEIFPPMSPIQSALLAVILIPTLIALIWGAPWVPTPKNRVRKMLDLAKLKKGETLYDLGCGDGRLVHIASAEYGIDAVGFEFSPVVYAMAKIVQPFYWLKGSRAKIKFKNFYNSDFSDIDVITCYLLPHSMVTVGKKCERELKKGSRVVSYAFPVLAWEPNHREKRQRKKAYGPIWVYKR
jgi:SAM-dependent methyltransferase